MVNQSRGFLCYPIWLRNCAKVKFRVEKWHKIWVSLSVFSRLQLNSPRRMQVLPSESTLSNILCIYSIEQIKTLNVRMGPWLHLANHIVYFSSSTKTVSSKILSTIVSSLFDSSLLDTYIISYSARITSPVIIINNMINYTIQMM